MRLQFYLGHPAHFHLFKNVILNLRNNGHEIAILIKKKDILEDLLRDSGISYRNILPEGRNDSKIGLLIGMLKRDIRSFFFTRKFKPDILIGTSVENSHISRILGIPSINVNEDDANVVPLYAKLSYPWASTILSPSVCNNGKWESKSIKYKGYHELAYLHPNHFIPNSNIAKKYTHIASPYFILRFAKLTAHHDAGVEGITTEIAAELISMLSPHGKIIISSERKLEPHFESLRMDINPLDMHHVLAFCSLYIGDSQTMAAEAAVLGTPFIRYNSFVGKLSYLDELENKYHLGFGIRPGNVEALFATVKEIVESSDRNLFKKRRAIMLDDKIDVANFLTRFIIDYPQSRAMVANSPSE